MRILLVEDHPRLGQSLRDALSREGYNVDWVDNLAEAHAALVSAVYSLMLLDFGMPDGDGLVFLKETRESGNRMPVLVLTARGGLNDRIVGLDGGADDYLVKPFAIAELLSRCRALLRRPHGFIAPEESFGNLVANLARSEIRINDQPIAIARRELQLLLSLLRKKQTVCSRTFLENELYDFDTVTSRNALEASVSRLRSLLKNNGALVTIRTIRGVGYVLELEDVT